MQALLESFSDLPDPRSPRNQKHPFLSLICIGILGAIAGIDSFSGLGDFAESHYESLCKLLELPNGPPSHDTLRRIFDLLDIDAFHDSFTLFTEYLSEQVSELIAIDGKRVCNAGTDSPLHLVSAWCESNQMVLAQKKVACKSNEITAIPQLLSLLDVRGAIVSIDAMGCQESIAQQIVDSGGDYLLALKGNQGSLLEDVSPYFNNLELFDGYSWQECDKGHGRSEERICYATSNIDYLRTEQHRWPALNTIAMVISKRTVKGKTTTEKRYYITSLPAHAERICRAARSHWGIENKLHWRLDVTYNEDKACIRNDNAAENMALLRKWALNILSKHKGSSSTKSLQRKAAMSFEFLQNLLDNIFHA